MFNFSSRLLALGFVLVTAFGLSGCGAIVTTRADGGTTTTTTVDPCWGQTVGGVVTGAVLGAVIGDSRRSAVNGSIAGGVLSSGQDCNGQQRQVEYRRAPQPVVVYIIGQPQPPTHQRRPTVNQTMCLYKLGWSNGGGGTTQGLRNDQFSPQQKAGDENLGRWAPGMAIPAGHAAKTC